MIFANLLFERVQLLQRMKQQAVWDVLVIGGGATGLGIAVDAASRGYSTLVLERADFAKGTSSRSTKLVHGGVRYLAQGNIPLVYSALKERGLLLQNAPHLVRKQEFIIPCYGWGETLKYGVGLKLYDALAGRLRFGKSTFLSSAAVLRHLPGLNKKGLTGGVLYFDGQFDDARLAINLAQTAIEHGAVVLNYMEVAQLQKQDGKITGVVARDGETGTKYAIQAKVVLNATGVFADAIQQLDAPGSKPLLKQSQGVHLVFDKSLFPTGSALMIPKTRDGRVLFAIPWHEHIVVGTTDTPVSHHSPEPVALHAEVDFILETLNAVLKQPVGRSEVQSVFAGLRPLVLPQKEVVSTKELSRDHKIIANQSGLITIAGGKWTTYRKMAEDAVNTAAKQGALVAKPCVTKNLRIHGFATKSAPSHLSFYGSDAMGILKSWERDAGTKKSLHPNFPCTEAEVIWAVRNEMARTVEDVLARRLRLLFLDAAAALKVAPRVACLMREELRQSSAWEQDQVQQFTTVAMHYRMKQADTITTATQPLPTI